MINCFWSSLMLNLILLLSIAIGEGRQSGVCRASSSSSSSALQTTIARISYDALSSVCCSAVSSALLAASASLCVTCNLLQKIIDTFLLHQLLGWCSNWCINCLVDAAIDTVYCPTMPSLSKSKWWADSSSQWEYHIQSVGRPTVQYRAFKITLSTTKVKLFITVVHIKQCTKLASKFTATNGYLTYDSGANLVCPTSM